MGCRIEQTRLRELAFDLDGRLAELAQEADAGRLIVDEGAAATVRADDAAKYDRVVLGGDAGFGQEPARRMIGAEIEFRSDHRLVGAVPDQPAFGAHAQRQAERVEQDRFTRAGFAGKDAEPRAESEIEPVDQHHIANGEAQQHRAG